MEPLKPDSKKKILATTPQASPQDIEEYERLLSQRFAVDPNMPKATPVSAAIAPTPAPNPDLLPELYRKLISNGQKPQP